MKKNLITILVLLLPTLVLAATNDFVANGNITVAGVTFGGTTANMLILNGSESESWLFSSGTFTVTNPGTFFRVGSSDSSVASIQVTQSGTTLACAENTTPGTSYASIPTTAGTYTVSPSATTACTSLCATLSNVASYNSFPTCGAASCNTGYNLDGSGASATCVAANTSGGRRRTIVPCGTGYGLSGEVCVPITSTPTDPSKSSNIEPSLSGLFSKNMSLGMTGEDVRQLQTLLASHKDVYSEGIITGYFGSLTLKAVQRFQVKYDVVVPNGPGYGHVGPKTRAKLQEVFGGAIIPASSIPPSASGVSFSETLRFGMQSSDVYKLQQLLSTDKEIYPEAIVSGYFGQKTKEAVQRFQLKYGVVGSNTDTGYGIVGPKTRVKLQEVFK